MKYFLAGAIMAGLFGSPAFAADQTLKMQTIAPSLGQAITMATFANVVTNNVDGISIEVAAGGAATLHMLEVARGNLDMSMVSPTIHILMTKGVAMYKKVPEAPELAPKIQLLMWFPYGQYHFAVRGDSDIKTLDDIEGAKVFLGPQGGGAFNAAKGWVKATTGLVAGEDFDVIKANWQTGYQAFLDGNIDVYVNGCIDPCQQFIQFSETESVRFIGPESAEGEAVDKFLGKFRKRAEIATGLYKSQVNETPVMSNDTAVGIGVRAGLDEDTVYKITKAFWDNLDNITTDAPWAKVLDPAYAAAQLGTMQLHPGAKRYYEEIGVK
ncbi:MAG: C4-dicarboxylate ABC transporter substrate-binding protein [Hyphomicrobiales bacterium]|nr:MAG: C4-dicarboxylate ABC transporter substrate-binding protein [Hyphomicrobiales bacterium]